MRRACGCHADPIVFGHTECKSGPGWIVKRLYWQRSPRGGPDVEIIETVPL